MFFRNFVLLLITGVFLTLRIFKSLSKASERYVGAVKAGGLYNKTDNTYMIELIIRRITKTN